MLGGCRPWGVCLLFGVVYGKLTDLASFADNPPRAWGLIHTLLHVSVVAVGLAIEPAAAPAAEDRQDSHTC